MAEDAKPLVTPGGTGGAADIPAPVYLSPQEQQAILASVRMPGATIVGGAARPKPKWTTNALNQPVQVNTGEYEISVQDAQGNSTTMTVVKGNPDAQGNATWLPGDLPKEPLGTKQQLQPKDALYVKGDGYYLPIDTDPAKVGDPNNYRKILPDNLPNADEEMKKALDRIDRQQEMTEKQNNFAAGRGYMTNSEYATMASKYAGDKLGQDKLAEDIRQYNATYAEGKRQFDIKQAASDKQDADKLLTSAAGRALTGAQTAGQIATTAGTEATTERTKAMLPGELAQQGATLASTQETIKTAQQARQVQAAPTIQGGLSNNVITTVNPLTGQVDQSQMNLAYQPKTQAEIAARTGQIHSLMQQKSDQVQAKVGQMIGGKEYTPEQAHQEFNAWYAQQIQPQIGALEAAQDEAAFARGKDQAAMRTAAFTAANAASTSATNAFNALKAANPVDDPAAYNQAVEALSKGKMPANLAAATTWKGPDPVAAAQQATMNALRYIDPTAAAATGTPPPNYQNMDIRAMTRNPYAAPGVPAGPAMGGAPAPAAAAPTQAFPPGAQPAPVGPGAAQSPEWWDAVMNRTRADQADQRIQAAAMPMPTPPGMYNSQFGAQYPSAVGQPATGPVAGVQMPDWLRNGTPPPPDNTPGMWPMYSYGG